MNVRPQFTVTLRPYCEGDWAAVRDIYDLSKPDELRGVIDTTAIPSLEDDPRMKQLFRESQIAVAEEDGTIVGFAGNRGTSITWLFVHPSFRRRGIATSLVKDMLRKLKQPVTLNVALTNGPAMSLYQRMGFKLEREFLGDFNGHPCKVARLQYAAAA